MQQQADVNRLAVDVGMPAAEIPPAIGEAHGHLCRFGTFTFEGATELLKRGGVELAEQINTAVTDARHTGFSGVRRALSHVIGDFERLYASAAAPLAASSTATDPPSDAATSIPAGDGGAPNPSVET